MDSVWSKKEEGKPKASNAKRWGCLILILLYPVVIALYGALDIGTRTEDFFNSLTGEKKSLPNWEEWYKFTHPRQPLPDQPLPEPPAPSP